MNSRRRTSLQAARSLLRSMAGVRRVCAQVRVQAQVQRQVQVQVQMQVQARAQVQAQVQVQVQAQADTASLAPVLPRAQRASTQGRRAGRDRCLDWFHQSMTFVAEPSAATC